MLMNSRGGPPFWCCMLMNFERGSASRDNFYGFSGTFCNNHLFISTFTDQRIEKLG